MVVSVLELGGRRDVQDGGRMLVLLAVESGGWSGGGLREEGVLGRGRRRVGMDRREAGWGVSRKAEPWVHGGWWRMWRALGCGGWRSALAVTMERRPAGRRGEERRESSVVRRCVRKD